MSVFSKEKTTILQEKLAIVKNIVVVMHKSPDGDALGSSLGLYHFLTEQFEKEITVIAPDDFPHYYKWLPNSSKTLIYHSQSEVCGQKISYADIIFCLDFSHLSRLGYDFGNKVAESKAFKVVIDHHQEPDIFPDLLFSDTKASSTAEMIYDLIRATGFKEVLSQEIASCLYTGIVTDTGSFKFNSTTEKTHAIASILLESEIEHDQIHAKVFDQSSVGRIKLLGFMLAEKLHHFPELGIVIIDLTKEELEKHGYRSGDTEGFVNYGLSIAGVEISVMLTEKNNEVRMSFRSKGKYPVNGVAKDYFSGGGHLHAAGGISHVSIDETKEKLLNILPNYLL